MKKISILTIALILIISISKINAQKTGTFKDNRDGKIYKTVKIGEQVWMAENLAYKTGNGCWVYNDSISNVDKYGYLYNWETAKNVCPQGYHLPSDKEWEQFAEYIMSTNNTISKDAKGYWQNMGGLLKAKSGWNKNGNGTDKFGFSALPNGYRASNSSFDSKGDSGSWWGSTQSNNAFAWCRNLNNINGRFGNNAVPKSLGFSVRCIKN